MRHSFRLMQTEWAICIHHLGLCDEVMTPCNKYETRLWTIIYRDKGTVLFFSWTMQCFSLTCVQTIACFRQIADKIQNYYKMLFHKLLLFRKMKYQKKIKKATKKHITFINTILKISLEEEIVYI